MGITIAIQLGIPKKMTKNPEGAFGNFVRMKEMAIVTKSPPKKYRKCSPTSGNGLFGGLLFMWI